MSEASVRFRPSSFVKVRLLQEVLYREDQVLWADLLRTRDEVARYFFEIGQLLVVDEAEGFAFIRQIEPEGDERVPRLVAKRPLGYDATVLLVCLREELARFETASPESDRLVRTRTQLQELVSAFLREGNNEVREVAAINTAIAQLSKLGFLREREDQPGEFEVLRIIKARVTPAELTAIRDRIRQHAFRPS